MNSVLRKVLGFAGFAAGLGVVSWLLKDRLVPVPDTGTGEPPPPFRTVPQAPEGTAPKAPEHAPSPPPEEEARTAAPAPEPAGPAAAEAAGDGPPDDLTEINGIGPVFAARLSGAGIATFAALAAADPERVAEAAQARPDQAEDWIAQARQRS